MKLKLMKVAVLTAALQEIVTRKQQDENPLLPVLKWLDLAEEIGCDGLQLAAAFHPADSYIPPEAMLDPVADHLPLRQELSDDDAAIIIEKSRATGMEIFDLGVFENLLHHDPAIRAKIHAHLLKAARAAAKLRPAGCRGVTGFIGRDITKDMDQQLALFEERAIPLLQEFKKLGLTYWVEPCPMPGWNTTDTYINNIAYCPGMWIALYKICRRQDVEDVFRVTYDESHDILMGTSHHNSFSAMKAAWMPFVVNRFHGKDQVVDPAKLAVWGYRGQTVLRGDRHNGMPDPRPSKRCNAWDVMTASHGLPGLVHYNPAKMAARRQVDWFDHQLGARRVLGLDQENTVFIIEHEWSDARQQDLELVKAILSASVQFIKGADRAAAAMYQAETEVCPEFSLFMPSEPNPMYEIPGLAGATFLQPAPALETAEPAAETGEPGATTLSYELAEGGATFEVPVPAIFEVPVPAIFEVPVPPAKQPPTGESATTLSAPPATPAEQPYHPDKSLTSYEAATEPPAGPPAITVKSSAPVIKGGHRILPKTNTNKLATENLEHPGYACD